MQKTLKELIEENFLMQIRKQPWIYNIKQPMLRQADEAQIPKEWILEAHPIETASNMWERKALPWPQPSPPGIPNANKEWREMSANPRARKCNPRLAIQPNCPLTTKARISHSKAVRNSGNTTPTGLKSDDEIQPN